MMRKPPPRDPSRRAVVTGMGAITPLGNDVATYWSNLVAGVSGVDRISAFDPTGDEVQIAAEVKDFDPKDWMDFKQARRMSRFARRRKHNLARFTSLLAGVHRLLPTSAHHKPDRLARYSNRGGDRLLRSPRVCRG